MAMTMLFRGSWRRTLTRTTPPPIQTTGGPADEETAEANASRRLGRIERTLGVLTRRIEAVEQSVKRDRIAPLPSVYEDREDGEG